MCKFPKLQQISLGETATHVTVTHVTLLSGGFYCSTQSVGI